MACRDEMVRTRSRGDVARCIWRGVAVVAVVGALAGMRPSGVAASAGAGKARVAQSYYFLPEVRLRKFHLVRPDLIPYPVVYEVYC
jgi:hypothetical protein